MSLEEGSLAAPTCKPAVFSFAFPPFFPAPASMSSHIVALSLARGHEFGNVASMSNFGLHHLAWGAGDIAYLYGVMFLGLTAAFWPGHSNLRISLAVGAGVAFLIAGLVLTTLGSVLDETRRIRTGQSQAKLG